MTDRNELGSSRLDTLYVIEDHVFDTLEEALVDMATELDRLERLHANEVTLQQKHSDGASLRSGQSKTE